MGRALMGWTLKGRALMGIPGPLRAGPSWVGLDPDGPRPYGPGPHAPPWANFLLFFAQASASPVERAELLLQERGLLRPSDRTPPMTAYAMQVSEQRFFVERRSLSASYPGQGVMLGRCFESLIT